MSVANSGLLGSLEQITTITATVEALKVDVDAVEAEIVNLVAGQGTLITDVSNLTTTVTSVNAQVQLLNSGDMTITGQKTFDGTTIFNGEVDMTSTNNKTIGNTGGGITRIDGNTTIGTLGSPTDLSGNVNINTGFTNNNTIIGNASGAGQLTIDSTTNLNGAVNATSTNNKTIGNTGGGVTQIKGTTQINSADIGNTDIGNAGGGVTKLSGVLQLSGGSAFFPVNIPASISYGNPDTIGNWRQITTAGFQSYTLNTSVFGVTNSTPLPYGRYVFNMRVFIQATTQQIGYLNVFPVFTNTAQVRNATQTGIQNQVSFGGQREGYIDFVVASGQRQVFNEGGFFYLDNSNFNYPIVGAGFFLSQSCDFNIELSVARIA